MIETRDVRVDYRDGAKTVTAVSDLSLEIGRGEVYGLIGPNGAGKTSTIKVLATLMLPTYGDVRIDGIDVAQDPRSARSILGYMPDLAPVYKNLKCWEFLDLYAGAFSLPRSERKRRVAECLELVNLTEKRDTMAGTLSRGMTQRLVLAKTVLTDPKVMLLDEPASGLDPIARRDLRDLLRKLADRGKTILVSSHILTELSEFCTSIGIMEKGRLKLSGRIEDIAARMEQKRRYVIEFLGEWRSHVARVESSDGVSSVELNGRGVEFDFGGSEADATALLKQLVIDGLPISAFFERRVGVEDILLHVGAKEVS